MPTYISKLTIPNSQGTKQTYDIRDTVPQIEITYSDLATLASQSNLVPGQRYRITDYETFALSGVSVAVSAGHYFDVIVTADSESTISRAARATWSKRDTDGYFDNSALNEWELTYIFSASEINEISNANTHRKGLIIWMKDEFGNECPYDFKNMRMSNPIDENDTGSYYTFSEITSDAQNNIFDNSLNRHRGTQSWPKKGIKYCYNNKIDRFCINNQLCLNGIIFKSSYNSDSDKNINCYDNTIYYNSNTMVFNPGACGNTFKEFCSNIATGINFVNNEIGENGFYLFFGDNCNNNKFGNNFMPSDPNNFNLIGHEIQNCKFGNKCTFINLGSYTNNNTKYRTNYIKNCTIGENCTNLKLGKYIKNLEIGNDCFNVSIFGGSYDVDNIEPLLTRNIKMGNNCSNINISHSHYTDSSDLICEENINIGNFCDNINIGCNAYNVHISDTCSAITIETESNNINIGNNSGEISIGSTSYNVKIGNNCRAIHFITYDSSTASNYTLFAAENIEIGNNCYNLFLRQQDSNSSNISNYTIENNTYDNSRNSIILDLIEKDYPSNITVTNTVNNTKKFIERWFDYNTLSYQYRVILA